MKRTRKFLAVSTIGFLALAGVAHADTFNTDGDALTPAAQSHTVAVNLAPGGTTTKTVGAYIESQGGANSHVTFPVAVTMSITNNDDGILSNLTSSAGNISAYGVANELPTTVTVTAPSTGLTCGVNNLFSGKVQFASTSGNLSPNQTFATINLTVAGPACSGPVNAAPVVDAGGPYTGNEGSAVNLDGTVTDDGTPTTSWSYAADPIANDVDTGATCSFGSATTVDTTVTCTDDGTYILTLSADDGTNTAVTDTATLTIGNATPAVGTVSVTQTSACGVNVSATFSDAGSNDTHKSSIDWGDNSATSDLDPDTTPVTGSHTYTSAGPMTITVTVTDDDDDDDDNTGSFTTQNTPSAFLAPINNAPATRSVFKIGSTVPVKITVTDCGGGAVSTLTPVVQLQKVDNVPEGGVNEPAVVEAATNGKNMRWSETQYIYNLSTKRSQFCTNTAITGCTGGDLTNGTYKLSVTDGSFFAPMSGYIDLKS